LLDREDTCKNRWCRGESTIEEQSTIDLDALMFRDNYADRDDDEYRRCVNITVAAEAERRQREWRDELLRRH
jgi:hypothetical protein